MLAIYAEHGISVAHKRSPRIPPTTRRVGHTIRQSSGQQRYLRGLLTNSCNVLVLRRVVVVLLLEGHLQARKLNGFVREAQCIRGIRTPRRTRPVDVAPKEKIRTVDEYPGLGREGRDSSHELLVRALSLVNNCTLCRRQCRLDRRPNSRAGPGRSRRGRKLTGRAA